jgi:hypothetical protein
MKTTYINRYGDEIIFEQTETNKIEMSGYDVHIRVSYADEEQTKYRMVDPSGGPYITTGMNIGRYFDGKIGNQIVEKIEFGNNKIIFTTKNENN